MTKYFPTPLLLLFFLLNSFQVNAAFPVKKEEAKQLTTQVTDAPKHLSDYAYYDNGGWAVASFLCAILGFMLPFLFPILAIIFGGIGLKHEKNRGLAIVGLVMGLLELILTILFIALILTILFGFDSRGDF